jgi:PhoH-like ATPase
MPKKKKHIKIFVLDTSVLLFENTSILNFEDNDIALPITVLEELDRFKKGNESKNFEAREVARLLDDLADGKSLDDWVPLGSKEKGRLKVVLNKRVKKGQANANKIFGERKNDHDILNCALTLKEEFTDQEVVLVTKDINLRLKAKSLKIIAEDYKTGKIKDIEEVQSRKISSQKATKICIDKLHAEGLLEAENVFKTSSPKANQYMVLQSTVNSALAYYNANDRNIRRVEKQTIAGIKPKNAEQALAIHAIMNPEIKLLTIQGVAGTGKTLLTLAGAIEQKRDYKQIFLSRPVVPLSNKDIGYLPGDIKSKLNPYMEPLWDNLKYIKNQYKETDRQYKVLSEMVEQEKLMIQPLAYIRGRSLSNVFFIVDEAQNLTPHEIKTIITRAGENTKIVFTGDVRQIDSPYLDAQSNGLSYLIDRIHDHPLCAHIHLEKGERSELANIANDLL